MITLNFYLSYVFKKKMNIIDALNKKLNSNFDGKTSLGRLKNQT